MQQKAAKSKNKINRKSKPKPNKKSMKSVADCPEEKPKCQVSATCDGDASDPGNPSNPSNSSNLANTGDSSNSSNSANPADDSSKKPSNSGDEINETKNNEENQPTITDEKSTQSKKNIPKQPKHEHSKTIIRKLSVNAGVKTLSTECYPLILSIIEQVIKIIADKLMSSTNKKTITITEIQPIIEQSMIDPKNNEFGLKFIDPTVENMPIFTAAAFKRQLKKALQGKYRISPAALKLLQYHVENVVTNILCIAKNVSQNAKRKRVMTKDIEFAWQMHIKY